MKYSTRRIPMLFLAAILVFAMVSCSNSGNQANETYEFSLAHFFPGTHPAETEFIKGWAERLSSATDGRVIITSYPGGTLLGADAIYNGVVEGVADMGLSCFSYTRGRFPVLEVFELPGIIYDNSKSASEVAWEGIKQLNPEEVQDTKLLMVIATGPGDLFTTVPVRTLEDMKGLEIRATGLSAKTIEALGGIPVGMPQSDAYEALSKGIVKGNLSPVEVLKGWKHAEVTDYLTRTPFLYNTLFFVTMNLEKWNSLPEEIQRIIVETTEAFHEEVGIGLWDSQNDAGLSFAVDDQGMEVIDLSEEEAARWIEKVSPIQDDYQSVLSSLGIEEDVLGLVKSLADKYNKIH
ncbi:MAG: TRAP transporter substrate-binding protein [Clostridia bacterium]